MWEHDGTSDISSIVKQAMHDKIEQQTFNPLHDNDQT